MSSKICRDALWAYDGPLILIKLISIRDNSNKKAELEALRNWIIYEQERVEEAICTEEYFNVIIENLRNEDSLNISALDILNNLCSVSKKSLKVICSSNLSLFKIFQKFLLNICLSNPTEKQKAKFVCEIIYNILKYSDNCKTLFESLGMVQIINKIHQLAKEKKIVIIEDLTNQIIKITSYKK